MTSHFEQDGGEASGTAEDLAAVVTEIKRVAGCDHVTLLALEGGDRRLRRICSSAPELFPVHGTKSAPEGSWFERIIEARRPVLFAGVAEVKSVFPDHQRILGLGIDAVLNIPVIRDSRCVGTVNCLYRARPAPDAVQPIARSVSKALDEAWT